VGELLGRQLLRRQKETWEDDIELDLVGMGSEDGE
jgi:hypothetical protein